MPTDPAETALGAALLAGEVEQLEGGVFLPSETWAQIVLEHDGRVRYQLLLEEHFQNPRGGR